MEGGSSGEENANLYVRGVDEGKCGEQPNPSSLIELLDVFGEDGTSERRTMVRRSSRS